MDVIVNVCNFVRILSVRYLNYRLYSISLRCVTCNYIFITAYCIVRISPLLSEDHDKNVYVKSKNQNKKRISHRIRITLCTFQEVRRNQEERKPKKKKKNSHRSQFGCKGLLLNLTIEGRWMEQRSDVGTPYVHGKKRPAPDGDQPLVRKFGRLQIGIYPLTVTSSQ